MHSLQIKTQHGLIKDIPGIRSHLPFKKGKNEKPAAIE